MPEVCEVVIMSHYLTTIIKNEKIISIEKDNKLEKLNYPLTITNIDTKGKFLWFELTDSKRNELYILNTFGLVGKWIENKPEKYNIMIELSSKKLYFIDNIKLGSFRITTDKNELIDKLNDLASDFLKTSYTDEEFIELFKSFMEKHKRKENIEIVKLLMNQKQKDGIGSGLGNYLTPEILYRSKISPHRKLKDLSNNDLSNLNQQIQFVTKWCYIHNSSDYVDEISDYLTIHYKEIKKGIFPNFHPNIEVPKEPFVFEVYRQKKDKLGNNVSIDKIIGNRKTYWVSKIQV